MRRAALGLVLTAVALPCGVASAHPAVRGISPRALRGLERRVAFPRAAAAWVQQATLSNTDGADGDNLGWSAAIDGDTIVVGAPRAANHAGAAYVFVKGAGGWATAKETAKLTPTDPGAGKYFGWAVSVSGDTVVVGAPSVDSAGNHQTCDPDPHLDTGAAYVFVKPAGGWASGTETAKLTPALSYCASVDFGADVAIDGATIVAGAPYEALNNSTPTGAAYVFTKPAAGWASASSTVALKGSDEAPGALFATSVAVSGDTVVAGAPVQGSTGGYRGPGRAYVFLKPGGGWAATSQQNAELSASDADGNGDVLGTSVAVSGDTVVAGAPYQSVPGANGGEAGRIYLYSKPAGGWAGGLTQNAELIPAESNGNVSGFHLGSDVAISGDRVVGGGADDVGAPSEGAVFTFDKPAAGWPASMTQTAEIDAPTGSHGAWYGHSVGVSGDVVVAGTYGGAPNGRGVPPQSGDAYVAVPAAATASPTPTPTPHACGKTCKAKRKRAKALARCKHKPKRKRAACDKAARKAYKKAVKP